MTSHAIYIIYTCGAA